MPISDTSQITRRKAVSWVIFQIIAVFIISLIMALIRDTEFARGIMAGGLIAIIPNLIFAVILFAIINPRKLSQMLIALYVGETLKLLLTSAIFLFVLYAFAVKIAALLAGMMIAIVAFWLAPLVMNRIIK